MKSLAFATLAALSLCVLAACEQQPESSPLSKALEAERTFQRVDGNKDGVVSSNEASAVANLDFGTADKDRNGALTPEEFEVAVINSSSRDSSPRG